MRREFLLKGTVHPKRGPNFLEGIRSETADLGPGRGLKKKMFSYTIIILKRKNGETSD